MTTRCWLFLCLLLLPTTLVSGEVRVRSLGVSSTQATSSLSSNLPASGRHIFEEWTIQPETLSITTNHRDQGDVFSPGETLVFTVKPNTTGYLTILSLSDSGEMMVLYPNSHEPAAKIEGGQEIQVPRPDSRYSFKMGQQPATDMVKIVLTADPDSLLKSVLRSPMKPYERIERPREALQQFCEPGVTGPAILSAQSVAIRTSTPGETGTSFGVARTPDVAVKVWLNQPLITAGTPFRLEFQANASCRVTSITTTDQQKKDVNLLASGQAINLNPGQIVVFPASSTDAGLFCQAGEAAETLQVTVSGPSGKAGSISLSFNVAHNAVQAAGSTVPAVPFGADSLSWKTRVPDGSESQFQGGILTLKAPGGTDLFPGRGENAPTLSIPLDGMFSREVTLTPEFSIPGQSAGMFLETADGLLIRAALTRTDTGLEAEHFSADREQVYDDLRIAIGSATEALLKLERLDPATVKTWVKCAEKPDWEALGEFTGAFPDTVRFGYFIRHPATGAAALARFQQPVSQASAPLNLTQQVVQAYLAAAPTRETEEQEIRQLVDRLFKAMEARDPEKAAEEFLPEVREKYRATFREAGDKLPEMGAPLKSVKTASISRPYGDSGERRTADLEISFQGNPFSIRLVKHQNRWFVYRF